MNILFVGAHPDDIESYAGGTAALYAKMGANVFFCIATNGNIGSSNHSMEEIRQIRHKEAQAGAAVIGAKLIWLDFDDEFLFDNRETRLAFIEAFRIADSDVVFCHWKDDYNPDHSISSSIVDNCVHMASIPLIKTKSQPTEKIPLVYYMDTPAGVGFEPEIYVDITSTFDTKVEMVSKHESQNQWMIDIYGTDMSGFLKVPASYRGFQVGCQYAEAFRPSIRWGRTFIEHPLPNVREVSSTWKLQK
ncbi:MAG: PIG-L family deacetylase [Planctomycetia bacterium]|nr:PIG-L family deacetylase [Planctomycetia bacterium]